MRILLLLLLLNLPLSAQEIAVVKGAVTDSLQVSDTLQENFALYIPKAFQPEKKWPVLFVFDPQGQGKTAARHFSRAAEEQGYIVAASNSISLKNSFLENVNVAARLVNSVTGRLPIDNGQVATAGAKAGGQVATALAHIYKGLLGTMAVGNQWVNLGRLDQDNEFLFVAIAGDKQFTAPAMEQTAEVLENLDFPTQVYSYEGADAWPKLPIINSAVGSLTLRAMRQNLRPRDSSLISSLFEQDLSLANSMISQVELVRAHNFLQLLLEKYKDLHRTDAVEEKLEQLKDSRNYRIQRREHQQALEKEGRLREDFVYYLREDIRTENFENLGWWNYQKGKLDSLVEEGGAQGKMASRLKSLIPELAEEELRVLEERHGTLEQKMMANMIQTIFDPRRFEAYRNIISLSAKDNDFPTALFYLEEMLKHGYEDLEGLYSIEGTLGLKLTPEYNELIEKYLGTAKFHNNP